MLCCLDLFLEDVETRSLGSNLHVDVLNMATAVAPEYLESGFVSMLEASDFQNMERDSHCLGGIIDVSCGMKNSAKSTVLFTQ